MELTKVLMVGPDRGVHGGISAVVNEYYRAGLDKKVNLKYIGTMKEGSKLKKLFVAAFAYARFLNELKWCDVVHVHFSSDSSFLRKSLFIKTAYRHGKKIVLHQHGGDFVNYYNNQMTDKQRQNVKNVLAMGNAMLVLTSSWKEFFSGITDEKKIKVFPNGIYVGDDSNDVSASVGAEGSIVNKDYNKILFLGRICRDKGMDELLDAMKSVHDTAPDAMLYIGGIFEDETYKKKIEECNEFVTYLGWVSGEQKEEYLEKCGILVLPSYYEGFPVSIIEAMYKESAVIASMVGGIPDIISNGEDGILIPPKDTIALKNALIDLIGNPEKIKNLGQNGREKVKKCYSVNKNIEELLKLYKSL
jgi:glycosyltransferase involved in cell wall biosynthesis